MREIVKAKIVFGPCRKYRRRGSMGTGVFLLIFCTFSLPVFGYAQKFGSRLAIPKGFNARPVIPPVDYFLKDTDPYVKNDVFQRERFHMGKEFWNAVRAGQFQRALDDLNFVLLYVPNHPKALMVVGFISRAGGNPIIADLYYQKALRRYPHRALTHAQYGAYLAEIGKINEGIARLQKAIEMDPNLVSAHVWLARVYGRAGKRDLARKAVQRANEARARRAGGEGARMQESESLSHAESESEIDTSILPQERALQ